MCYIKGRGTYDFRFSLVFHERGKLDQTELVCSDRSTVPWWDTWRLDFGRYSSGRRFKAGRSTARIPLGERLDATEGKWKNKLDSNSKEGGENDRDLKWQKIARGTMIPIYYFKHSM